uniref:Uncharacterized protein n=1 Tax=Chromera velia CCMP2878 TaxID=1169474 RepID=A0A0G4FIB3_9ALVE|mmetsp:Transcript_42635/g.84095  ORF Transcript_42635/g.84095 Transcript_42635/m.84095 type:complete len:225 (-) Transcript_42635:208-882(-)|eukprot:Cvel_17016.t1-p1 / transcript=Cvel_17016.t1 / gene=Cvel_17016 / organism=Chromera_velia_CCMP2878 / gene_product=hypothetical protein / transcript_product=hypothetical protein / location=Cvel_scaffold1338:15842-16623(+) / protein_length=224 / sequence_SO=supercontig / SO=protein_coding / is_pseudo=false
MESDLWRLGVLLLQILAAVFASVLVWKFASTSEKGSQSANKRKKKAKKKAAEKGSGGEAPAVTATGRQPPDAVQNEAKATNEGEEGSSNSKLEASQEAAGNLRANEEASSSHEEGEEDESEDEEGGGQEVLSAFHSDTHWAVAGKKPQPAKPVKRTAPRPQPKQETQLTEKQRKNRLKAEKKKQEKAYTEAVQKDRLSSYRSQQMTAQDRDERRRHFGIVGPYT